MILLIDNYDSFTWNLVQCMGVLLPGKRIEVVRNDRIDVERAMELSPTHLVISPGPCTPTETGVCPDLLEAFCGRIPILGVCLGHQTIAAMHGMTVRRHDTPMHGKTSPIHHDGRGIFAGLPEPFTATRYHSLIVDRETVTDGFEISAWTAEGDVMGLRRRSGRGEAPMDGVQFHPESFLSTHGPELLANFLGVPGGDVAEVGCLDHA
ncbi:MAG: anthranilate/aminodeoxychorismate synthase component II [Phycisphaerae bacterium]|jgi:anthranilate synthase/aminodeoxychorismate synthase-like glutamine amidotransferase|nr:anthranilate/aminodeoxychorismate synthase component II [Phycisphaerae bacterium]|tara:strand:- start:2210 stop:2833 length:624 start_codon:yes stop_codon:yes gene_type:complete